MRNQNPDHAARQAGPRYLQPKSALITSHYLNKAAQIKIWRNSCLRGERVQGTSPVAMSNAHFKTGKGHGSARQHPCTHPAALSRGKVGASTFPTELLSSTHEPDFGRNFAWSVPLRTKRQSRTQQVGIYVDSVVHYLTLVPTAISPGGCHDQKGGYKGNATQRLI